MPERVLEPSAFRRMPWKNGGGVTTEIAAERDPGSSDFDFSWRVSLAEMRVSGPFSRFPGFDRLIMQLDGPTMELTHPDTPRPTVRLEPYRPYAFAGDWDTAAQLMLPDAGKDSPPAHDFNLIVRRDRATGALAAFTPGELSSGAYLTRLAPGRPENDCRILLYAHAGSFTVGDQPISEGTAYLWSGRGAPHVPRVSASDSARIVTALISLLPSP
jgi:environmental stress-induced protein Ves